MPYICYCNSKTFIFVDILKISTTTKTMYDLRLSLLFWDLSDPTRMFSETTLLQITQTLLARHRVLQDFSLTSLADLKHLFLVFGNFTNRDYRHSSHCAERTTFGSLVINYLQIQSLCFFWKFQILM